MTGEHLWREVWAVAPWSRPRSRPARRRTGPRRAARTSWWKCDGCGALVGLPGCSTGPHGLKVVLWPDAGGGFSVARSCWEAQVSRVLSS